MSTTIFRGTTLTGVVEREAHVYIVNDRIVIGIADGRGRILDVVSLDPDMAEGLAVSVRHRALAVRLEQEATA